MSSSQRPSPVFRRLVGKFTQYRSYRYLLNLIDRGIRSIKSVAIGPFQIETITTSVGLTSTVVRAAASNSLSVTVSNTGLNPAKIYESGALIMVLDSLESRYLPVIGLKVISAIAITSTTTVVVTTLKLQ